MGQGRPAELHFSPVLNALVGGRGTGKSTVIHALRSAARRDGEILSLNEGSIPRSTFERFNKVYRMRADEGALRTTTAIQWTIIRDGIRHRITCRPGKTPAAFDVEGQSASGEWVKTPSQSVTHRRFPVRIFSQGQIAELAGESTPALLPLIDEAAEASSLQSQLDEATNRYFTSRARIRELDSQLAEQDEVVVDLEDVERKLERFETSNHSTILKAYRDRTRQTVEVERKFLEVKHAVQRIAGLANELQLGSLPDGLVGENTQADKDYVDSVNAVDSAVYTAADELRETATRLDESLNDQRESLSSSSWREAVDKATANYERFVKELKSEGVTDPAEYGELVQQRQRLTEKMEAFAAKREERTTRIAESRECHQKIQTARREVSVARERFLSKALAKNDFVRITVQRYGNDARTVEKAMRDTLNVRDDRFEPDILKYENGTPTGIVATLLGHLPDDPLQRGAALETRLDRLKQRFESVCRGGARFWGPPQQLLGT